MPNVGHMKKGGVAPMRLRPASSRDRNIAGAELNEKQRGQSGPFRKTVHEHELVRTVDAAAPNAEAVYRGESRGHKVIPVGRPPAGPPLERKPKIARASDNRTQKLERLPLDRLRRTSEPSVDL